ncbi:SprT-like domain-containing protein [Micromonospora sp. WMMA1363]|uniref:SprT-like domain-containing protein n=1 Tax=Micromonospora sp. WMMA1363 TaxID=3053985 RepID=UPI00259CB77C|nr:SprT-like domain-containing protein [Micromonospora sp. WMMA1363]MDM4718431.1 SprT-like domain-containing protein [Micromonospora sp. WMMA1363]
MEIKDTREAWLHRAIDVFRPRFDEIGMPLPERVHVSVGFSYGARAESAKVLGSCWAKRASKDGVNHIFISPESGDTVEVLETLLHELIHAADDCESGHKAAFAEAATRLGFEGPMTATPAGMGLTVELMTMAETLGEYPHGALEVPARVPSTTPVPTGAAGGSSTGGKLHSGPAKQGTRMIKVVCNTPDCPCEGYTVRTTSKWLEVGAPKCPMGHDMERA